MTMIGDCLDVDMGNTRTKWRCGAATGAVPSPCLPTLAATPSRVRVATVLGNRDLLARAVRKRYGVEAEFAATTATLGGVACGYREPARLGIDRWLALVAAWQRVRTATVVVGAGTAATVDFVDGDGRHQGGHIAPGLRLLREVLGRRTAGIRPLAEPAPGIAPGTDTPAAVSSGTLVMLLAYVEAAIAWFADRHGGDTAIFLTGGDAERLAAHLSMPARCEPHLVLDGLAVALP